MELMEKRKIKEAKAKLVAEETELVDQETLNIQMKAVALKKEALVNFPTIPEYELELDAEAAKKLKD